MGHIHTHINRETIYFLATLMPAKTWEQSAVTTMRNHGAKLFIRNLSIFKLELSVRFCKHVMNLMIFVHLVNKRFMFRLK